MKKKFLYTASTLLCVALLGACSSSKTTETKTEEKSSGTVKVENPAKKAFSSSEKEKNEEVEDVSVLDLFNKELVPQGKSTDEVYVTGDIAVEKDGEVTPGIYDLEITGGNGFITVENDENYRYHSFFVASPDSDSPENASKIRIILFEGDNIKFTDISKVRFTAIGKDVKPSNELGIGQFVVGRDIEPGTYKLSTNITMDAEFGEEWRIEIVNLSKEDIRSQNLSKKNPDVAIKLEEGEVISLDFDNDYEPEKPTDDVRLIFTSVK